MELSKNAKSNIGYVGFILGIILTIFFAVDEFKAGKPTSDPKDRYIPYIESTTNRRLLLTFSFVMIFPSLILISG